MTEEYGFSFNPPEWRGHAVSMGELRRLVKGSRVAVCTMFNHPLGAEVRCVVDGELRQSRADPERAGVARSGEGLGTAV